MRPVHERWAETLRASHEIVVRVELWFEGKLVTVLPISDGTVTLDLDSEAYGALEITVADDDMLTDDTLNLDALLPFGQRLRVYWGLRIDGVVEMVSVWCDFLITSTPTSAGFMTDRRVSASTSVEMVKDARFLAPWQPKSTDKVRTVLTTLLRDAVPANPTVTFDMPEDPSVGAVAVYEQERWDAVAHLCDALDGWLQPIPGGFRVRKIYPDNFAGDPVWTVWHGHNLMSGSRPGVARDDRYNAVVAYNSENAAAWGVTYITDPASPVRWGGPYGKRPAYYASPLLATAASAQKASATRLASINGGARTAELETVTNAALEPGDVISVLWPGKPAPERMLVRKMAFPLTPGSMKLTVQAAPA